MEYELLRCGGKATARPGGGSKVRGLRIYRGSLLSDTSISICWDVISLQRKAEGPGQKALMLRVLIKTYFVGLKPIQNQ